MHGMRTLYHFQASPFSRRARLALLHKSLEVTLVDARTQPERLEEARGLSAFKTVPLLVDADPPPAVRAGMRRPGALVVGDSTAISHYLDRAYPEGPPLWPRTATDAPITCEVTALVDLALNGVIDLGARYHGLSSHPAWGSLQDEMVGRVQRALDTLGEVVTGLPRKTVTPGGWAVADVWLLTMVAWLEALPERAKTTPIPAQIIGLGWKLPAALERWAELHRDRADVRALDGQQ